MAQIDHIGILIGAGSWVGVASLVFCMVKYFPSQKFCDNQHQNNAHEREEIRNMVKENAERAEQRHKEYREDMRELKELIRNNGKPKLRVQT